MIFEPIGQKRTFRSGLRGGRLVLDALFVGTVLLLLGMSVQVVDAGEDLDLTGVIKGFNPAKGIVYVDVTSKSCPGMRTFRVDKPSEVEKYIEEQITFQIDSEKCNDNTVHTILLSRGIRK